MLLFRFFSELVFGFSVAYSNLKMFFIDIFLSLLYFHRNFAIFVNRDIIYM